MSKVKVLAITGPPCAGKSTITDIFSDIGVLTIDTGDAMREYARDVLDDPDEEEIWDEVSSLRDERGPQAPTAVAVEREEIDGEDLICVSGLRDQAEVNWLRENVGPTLVVRIDADSYSRSERYVRRELEDHEERMSVPRARVLELRNELYDRESREKPYPNHEVTIRNEDSVRIADILNRIENLVEVMRA